jgi:outer membrane receptor protein involved in Fe transport
MAKARTTSSLTDQFGNALTATSGQTNTGNLYFSAPQLAATASCLPGTGQNCAAIGNDAPGRANLRTGLWSPFGLGGVGQNDPMFKDGENTQRVENTYFSTSNTLKGDLGEVFGTQIDLRLSGQYTKQFYDVKGKGILVDRLQRALNGFATNLDDRSGTGGTIDRCTAAETYGNRAGATTATPYSVGAGGGWGDVDGAANGAVAGAGNGCYFFNPFASAVTNIMYGGGKAVQGNATTYGFINTGFYQGYGFDPNQMTLTNGVYAPKAGYTGSGLVNQNGIINWLFEDRQSRLTQDTLNLQAVINGSGGFSLKGGPLAWALGAEYRYYRRDQQYDILSNRSVNPCTFISNATGTALTGRANSVDGDDVNIVGRNNLGNAGFENYTASCVQPNNNTTGIAAANTATQTGVWLDSFGINSGVPFTKEERAIAAFGEMVLPFTDKLKGTASVRYERDRYNALTPAAAVVTAFNLSYQAAAGLTLRASTGQTFQNVDCSSTAIPNCVVGFNSATPQGTTGGALINTTNNPQLTSVGVTGISGFSRQDLYGNSALNPERGSNFSFGVVYHPTQALLASLDLVNIKIVGTRQGVSATQVARLLAGEAGVGASLTDADINKSICSAPSALFSSAGVTSPTGGAPLVSLVSATGATRLACQAGDPLTTIGGANIGGTPYGLLYSLPNLVNAGITQTRQLDEHLEYGLPNTFLGGKVQLTLDGTYLMFLNQDFGSYNVGGANVSLGAANKYKGLYSSDTASQTPSPFRGTIGALWRSGKNTINVQTHWAGAVADATLGTPFTATAGSVGTNYNAIPSKVGGCSATVANLLAPDPRMTSLVSALVGSPGQGEESINTNCNVGNYTGGVVPGFVTTDLTYIRQLPGRTSLTINVTNVLDKDPPFQKQQTNYYAAYGTGNALGRTVKVSIRKVF